MNLKPWQWMVLGALSYVFFLIKYLPAQWLLTSNLLPIDKSIQMQDVEGTIWNGKIRKLLVNGVATDNVSWQLSVSRLLIGQVNLDVLGGKLRDPNSVYFKGNVTGYLFNQSAFSLEDTTALIPAQAVLAQIQLPVPITARGRFKAEIDELDFDETCQSLQGTGGWNNGMVSGTQGPIEFGTFNAQLNCSDSNLVVSVQPDNKLDLEAEFTLMQNGDYSLNGRFRVPKDMPQEVEQAASFFGAKDPNGFRTIRL